MLYADRVFNPKFNKEPIIKPLLNNQQPVRYRTGQSSSSSTSYSKFGFNLGPSRPVIPKDKYGITAQQFIQSPMTRAEKPKLLADNYLINQNQLARKLMQDKINESRKLLLNQTQVRQRCRNPVYPASSLVDPQRTQRYNAGSSNLTFSQMGLTNNLTYDTAQYNTLRSNEQDSARSSSGRQIFDKFNNILINKNKTRQQNITTTKESNSPFKRSQYYLGAAALGSPQEKRKLIVGQSREAAAGLLTRSFISKSDYLMTQRPQTSFVSQYQTASAMLQRNHSKQLAARGNAASSLAIATRNNQISTQKGDRTFSASISQIQLGERRNNFVPEFFKTSNQHACDQLAVSSRANQNRQPVKEFSYTRYKQRAKTNYSAVPVRSYFQKVDNRQADFQMRITIDNGEPGLPISQTTVHKPIQDKRRFSNQPLAPYHDIYRENFCHTFISTKNSKILQKTAAKRKNNDSVFNQIAKTYGMRRKHGGGLFRQKVPLKPLHAIDSF